MNEGVKFDSGKNRIDLIPPEVLFALSDILTFGANKYGCKQKISTNSTINIFCDIIGICKEQQSVDIKIEKFTQKINVENVTKNVFVKQILNLENDKELIKETGQSNIQKKYKNTIKKDEQIQRKSKEIDVINISTLLKRLDYLKSPVIGYYNNKKINAESVKEVFQNVKDILIMTMKVDLQEVIFVAGATTDSECLGIMLMDLKKHFNISKKTQLDDLLLENNNFYTQSNRNWEKGMNYGRVFGALMRHLWKWWGGDVLDEETGKSHLWHALCNLAFLITYEQREVGTDDRGKKVAKNE